MAVIYIRISEEDKERLEIEAEELGMQVTTYCRMILLQSLKKPRLEEEEDGGLNV